MSIFKKNKSVSTGTNMNEPMSKPQEATSRDEDGALLGIKEEQLKKEFETTETKAKEEKETLKIEDIDEKEIENEDDDPIEKYKGFDFSTLSKKKMFSVIAELLMHIKSMEYNIRKYDSESDGIYEDYKRKSGRLKGLKKDVEGLARRLSPTFNDRVSKIQDHNLTSDEVIEMIVADYLKEKRKLQERILKLEKQKYQDKRLLESLKNQLSKLVEGDVNIKSEDGTKEYSEEDMEKYNSENHVDDVKIIAVDVKRAREMLSDTEYNILGIMGKEGYSLYPDIEEQAQSKFGYTESKIKTSIQKLEEHNLLKSETVKTPKIRRGVRVLEMTREIGRPLYKEKFNESPVESECSRIIKDHDNLEHGYSIVEVSKILEHQLGYIDVSHDREKNTIPVGGNKSWIPDIVALNPASNKKEYFEVEFGNHSKENFEDKLTKANLKAKVLRFVVPNALKKQKLKIKIDQWKGKSENIKSKMIISVGTVSDLEDKEYGATIN